jgi:hypothetical protein
MNSYSDSAVTVIRRTTERFSSYTTTSVMGLLLRIASMDRVGMEQAWCISRNTMKNLKIFNSNAAENKRHVYLIISTCVLIGRNIIILHPTQVRPP